MDQAAKDSHRKVVNIFFLHFQREEERKKAEKKPDPKAGPFGSRFDRVNFVVLTFIFRGTNAVDMAEFAELLPKVTAADVARFYRTEPEFAEIQRRYDPLRPDHQKILARFTNVPAGEFSEWRLKSVFPMHYGSLLQALKEAGRARKAKASKLEVRSLEEAVRQHGDREA